MARLEAWRAAGCRVLASAVIAVVVLACVVTAFPAGAMAQEAAAAASDAWIVTLGGSMAFAPTYEGARTGSLYFMPSFDIRRADEPATFSAPDDSFGIGLFDFDGVRFGVLGGLREGRPDWVIPGLPGYATTIEGGGFAEFWPVEGRLRTRIELLQGLAANAGLAANLSADLVEKQGPLTIAFGPRLSLGDRVLMQTEFGVPQQAVALGIAPPFDADAGIKSAGLATSLSYDWSQEWTTTVFGSYQHLAGAAAQSPVVTGTGSPNQLTVGLGFERSFTLGH